GVVDLCAGPAFGIGGRRHTERLVAILINAAWRAVACTIEGTSYRFAGTQGLAETLTLLGHQPIARRHAELGNEALAQRIGGDSDLTGDFAERRRSVGVGGIEQRA